VTTGPSSKLWQEDARPHVAVRPASPVTPAGRASQQTLLQVHDHLRQELGAIQQAVTEVAAGRLAPAAARALIGRLTLRQNDWTLGLFCTRYCRVVSIHNTIEDQHLFPALRQEDEALSAVLTHLGEEHEIIAEVLERFDRTLVAMMTAPSGIAEVRRLATELGEALLSHLAYEENEMLGPLGRSSIAV